MTASPNRQSPQGSPPENEGPELSQIERETSRLVLHNLPAKRGFLKKLLMFFLWAGLCAGSLLVIGVAGIYFIFSEGLPNIPKVEEYWPPIVTEVFTDDAVLAGEFYNQRRKVVPYDHIPKRLVQAFIASEDSSFFDHGGVDVFGTGRAATKTIIKKVTGRGSVQGGSTLTQQTAKAVLIGAEGYAVSTEKSLRRKIREAILALRLERSLTKEQILYLYLNNVYLGHHSYGVQSAAENYYRKDVRDLSLAEMALIAGLPQAPSRYSPFRNAAAAKRRRSYVLRRMLDEGMISQAEHDQANATEVIVSGVEDVFHDFAPYFTEEVRRDVVARYGNKTLLEAGLKVFTTMDSERQRTAQEAVFHGLLAVDKRQGFRGALTLNPLTEKEKVNFLEKARKAMNGEAITPGRFYVALVTMIDEKGRLAEVQVADVKGYLPLLGMRWARPLNPEQYYPSVMIGSIHQALREGDLVVVRAVTQKKELYDDKEQFSASLASEIPDGVQLFRLEQEPELQSALVSIDPHRQYYVAMVGGYDFDANEYNRAFQACRQPGSSFKPLVYAAAIEDLDWTEA
jgi:penicillin-binding protein 1A